MPEEEYCLLPPYLADDSGVCPEEAVQRRTYGVLSYNRRRKCWVVKGEMGMTEACKRLFPGCDSGKRGEVRFADHRRIVGELNWLMLRYPLVIRSADYAHWQESLAGARDYTIRREEARLKPQRVTPGSFSFAGKLMPFQEEGLAFLLRSDRCLLADEMGLGKTVQALAMLAETDGYPAMIVAPSHLICNWQNEIARFLRGQDGQPLTVHIVRGLTPYALPPADIYLMHYLLLRGWKEALQETSFQTLILDEVQELRHAGTEKYSAASLLSDQCEHVVGLSGTPIYNRGAEIWNVINAIDYHFLGDYDSFTREWCYGYGGQIVTKPHLLGDYLRQEGMMMRRTKAEVLPQLPPKRRLVMPIDSDESVYRQMMQKVMQTVRALKSDSEASEKQKALWRMEIEHGERQATGIAKAPYVAQFVRALLEAGEKVLLFAHHHEVMDIYRKELKSCSPVFITGRETADEKERSVERFHSGRSSLCCISLRAASGLNLQEATCVVFGELDWSPAVHSQAEDRAHRIGQQDSLLCYYLVTTQGSDRDIQDALGLKVSQFVGLMGDTPPSEDQMLQGAQEATQYMDRLLNRLLKEAK